jgi:hypothetical protein
MINQLLVIFVQIYLGFHGVFFAKGIFIFQYYVNGRRRRKKQGFDKVSCQEPVSICFSSLGAKLLCGQQSCKSEILSDGIDDTAKYEHCI